ncbi:hypothetical protein G1H11_12130 [Phytoactinopolyspora alkaliphila]|uniref:Uncharacterized protein n=1 Tax=Phytoactinopolyspora alkaliphila TaxID=1783498 RepID=A0A6N9YLZ0_9ACTN|nr:SdrD B-like domain-containing protein [Phytoactinopolyspora alkaliphila]NED96056.1 hypothetical protein [Phytoactinopolyspora alkaliphila]
MTRQETRRLARKGVAALGAVAMLGSMLTGVLAPPAAQAAVGDEITGTIWQDYDSNGMLDAYEDSGLLEGIEVYGYDAEGNVAGPALTGADGTYTLPVTSDAGPWRVEANVPDTPDWAEWRDSVVGRAAGASNGTTVQFVDSVPASDVNFSFQVPGAFVENNPRVFLPAYRYGTSDGPQGGEFAGAAHLYDAVSADSQSVVPITMQVPFREVGATYGTAWQRAEEPGGTGAVFASAYMRRHSGLGPAGLGAIYRIVPDGVDLTSPTAGAQLMVDLTAHGIDVGDESDTGAAPGDPRGLRPRIIADNPQYEWLIDAQAWDKVGRVGLGGMEISNDQESLFVVNLHNRSLVQVRISRDGTSVLDVVEHDLSSYFPVDGDLRPFGVSSNPLTNEMYLTVTDTAESTQNSADLHGYVYAFDPADPTNLREVLDFPLGYSRHASNNIYENQPWSTDSADYTAKYNGDVIYTAVPFVSEARYLHGDLVVGVRDLGGDLFGSYTHLAPDHSGLVRIRSLGGELLKAGSDGDGTWTIEQNGVVNGEKGTGGAGAGSVLNGPFGPDKFFTDNWLNGAEHLGATLVVPSREDGIMETGIHVGGGAFQVGTRRFYQESGATFQPRGALVITGTNEVGATLKGNGLGELTAMASAAPIEIGNYVWYDIDNDGVQDPDEPVVEGATVNLYEVDGDGNRTLVNTTLTDAKGEYYFSSNDDAYQLQTRTDYVVGVDNPDDYAEGGPLHHWYPTVPNTGDDASVDADRNDSDGIVEQTDEGSFPYAEITTGGPGENDHTIDFGYSNIDYEFDKRLIDGPTENPDDDGTWTITYELVAENTGMIDGSYLLTDDLTGYGQGIEVVGTEVVSGPPEADGLLNPDWDGVDDQRVVTDYVPIDAQSTIDNGTEHVYTIRVAVRLNTDPETGEADVDPEQLECVPDAVAGDEDTTGLFNVATMSPDNHEDLVDQECGELPLVTLDKTVEVEPYVVDRQNLPGVWEIVYGLTVTNETEVATDYDLEDRLRFGSGIDIVEGSVVAENTDPGGIAIRPEFDGLTDTLIVEDEPIDGSESHHYTVTVRFTIDLPDPPSDPDPSDCSLIEGEEDGTGLYNDANTSFNGYPDYDDECREVGQPSHEKTLISAEPIGDGQWEVVYGIEVINKGVQATFYDLDDELRFTDQVDIVSAEVTSAPDGVTLYDPAWDGQEQLRIAEEVTILGTDDDGYAPHEYVLTVIADAPLSFELGDDGSDPTACPAPGTDPTANTAFNNGSTLTDESGLTEEDDACAELPAFEIDKTISSGPVGNGDGTWTITYDVVARNEGSVEHEYTVTDRLRYGDGIVVESSEVITTPDGVDALDTWTGLGEPGDEANVIATGVLLDAGGEHLYQIQVVFSLDDELLTEESMSCPEPGSGGNGGLANGADLEHNDLTDDAEVCASLGEPDLDKTLVSAEPIGNGQWEVHYDITVRNLLPGETVYDLEDELLYGEGVNVESADVVAAPDGVTTRDDWDGVSQLVVAESVTLPGMNDDGYAPHVYTVRVVADVPPTFQVDDDGNSQARCQDEPGENYERGGLNNVATLHTDGGDELTDTDCADLPSIELDKTVASGPDATSNGRYVVAYELEVVNNGAAEGTYVLRDQFRFGEGIEILDIRTANLEPGDIEVLESFTGQGTEPEAAENALTGDVTITAGASHTYEVKVLFTLDGDTVTAESARCVDEPGDTTRSGLLNVGLLDHNGHQLESDACEPVDPPDGDEPPGEEPPGEEPPGEDPEMPDTGTGVQLWLLLAGVLLVLGGAGVASVTRRRTAKSGAEG